MATYQIINLETGEFSAVTLEDAAALAQLDPADIEWAIEEEGVCETEIYQITKLPELPEPPEENGERDASDAGDGEIVSESDAGRDASDASDADFILPLPVFVYISPQEFEARFGDRGGAPYLALRR